MAKVYESRGHLDILDLVGCAVFLFFVPGSSLLQKSVVCSLSRLPGDAKIENGLVVVLFQGVGSIRKFQFETGFMPYGLACGN